MASAGELHARYDAATASLEPPFALVDLDAMWRNAGDMLARRNGKPLRVASKSLRCRPLLERILARDPGFQGLLTYTLPETLFLTEHGLKDLVLAYPTTDREALARLAEVTDADPDGAPAVMVDASEQLDLIERCAGSGRSPVRVAIEIDVSYWIAGGRIKIGAKRSPIRSAESAVALAREIESRRDVRLVGGTGSIETTAAEDAVTEVAAGSGFYAPTLFDNYSSFRLRPAAMFALPVVRKPAARIATALGGGYLASGAGDSSRLPTPYLPNGLKLDPLEGAGEVQTPLLGRAAASLRHGDKVYFRHAKAGELCERFASLYLVAGDEVVDEVSTYRGEGACFL
jgi:D-serine deaminase-like pyridoxal phosphate-dependent protein